jgi:hypothetical protein
LPVKRPVVSTLLGVALVLMASSAAVARAPARGAPRLLGLRITSGRPFAGDRRLLATVSPNSDGLRDRAVVQFRLARRATVAMHVFVTGKRPRGIRTIKRRFGPGRHVLVWSPRATLEPRAYLLRLIVTAGGAKRVYGSLVHSLARVQPAPVVRLLGISAAFTKRSYAPGSTATIRIATDEPYFTLQLFQAGPETQATVGGELQGVSVTGQQAVDWSAHRDAPSTLRVQLGDWPSGIYFARLTGLDGRSFFAPLVIRPAHWGLNRIAVVVHTNTWQAYNFQDENGDGWGDTWYAAGDLRRVDLSRPYIGLGAPPRWRKYDLPFLRWLYRSGKQVDFMTDDDLRRFSSPRDLARLYDLIVFPGYDEYETRHVYDLVTGYRNRGGNLIFLSATNFLWKVERHGSVITRIAQWRQLGRPEARLVGVEYRGNDEGQHHGRYVLSSFGRDSWELAGINPVALGEWRWFGIEYDMVTGNSPHGIHVLARVNPHMHNRRLRGEMTYYRRGAAKVFAAGTLNFPAALVYPQFRRLLSNVWARLAVP